MWIVAVAWIYVVGLMALTEPSVVAGVMTFLLYCILPLSLFSYIFGSRRRRQKRSSSAGLSALPGSAQITAGLPVPTVDPASMDENGLRGDSATTTSTTASCEPGAAGGEPKSDGGN